MHAWWTEPEELGHLDAEVQRALPDVPLGRPAPGFITAPDSCTPQAMAFARQSLPNSRVVNVPSIRTAAESITEDLLEHFPDDAPWRLHVASCYGASGAGSHRCQLISEAVVDLLRRRRRHRLKLQLADGAPPREGEAWIQWLLMAPDRAMASTAPPALAHSWRMGLVPFPAGRVPVAVDKSAPSRAFAKLAEAECRLGQSIVAGQSVVDLGASPGSWTYWAVGRGARVVAVDRSPLRDDLMADARVRFHQGDAFQFEPGQPVDWLVCDVIAAPRRSIDLAIHWARQGWARRLVVTVKFKGDSEYPLLDELKTGLAPLCEEFRLARLCANRNEACVMGVLSRQDPASRP